MPLPFPDERADGEEATEVEVDPVRIFLNRWAFNWRGELDVIERELRQLITEARS